MTGKRFGRLMVIGRGPDHESKGKKTRRWYCKCDCGKELLTFGNGLRSGHAKSCGCLQKETVGAGSTRHGMSTSGAYKSWAAMKSRCSDKSNSNYPNYGGRGIGYCKSWELFENFLADMGDRPPGCSIDRINVNADYGPLNCKWSSKEEQENNKRTNVLVTVGDKTLTLSQWSRELGEHVKTLSRRYQATGSFDPIPRVRAKQKGEIVSDKPMEHQASDKSPALSIEMHAVTSNQIRSIGYDAATETLAMQFKHGAGAIYHYPNVTKELHESMMSAESIGKFFGQHIKPLPFVKYAPEPVAAGGPEAQTAEEAA